MEPPPQSASASLPQPSETSLCSLVSHGCMTSGPLGTPVGHFLHDLVPVQALKSSGPFTTMNLSLSLSRVM